MVTFEDKSQGGRWNMLLWLVQNLHILTET